MLGDLYKLNQGDNLVPKIDTVNTDQFRIHIHGILKVSN